MLRALVLGLSGTMLAGTAGAAVLTVSGSATLSGYGLPSGSALAQFDPTLGTLTGVTIDITSTRTTAYQSVFPFSSAGATGHATIGIGPDYFGLTGRGDAISGDWNSTFTYTISGETEASLTGGRALKPFIGTGTLDLSGFLGQASLTGAAPIYHSGSASTDVTLSYTYRPEVAVPEVGTWGLMITGFGLVGGITRHARRRVLARG